MSLSKAQDRIKARVWQAVAQAELDLSGIDKSTLESFVDLVTEAALLEVDDEIGKSLTADQPTPSAPADDDDEDILWQGRPFLSPTLHYTITDERIKISTGLLGKAHQYVELIRIQDMDHSQTFGERLLKIGDVNIRSHDPSHPQLQLKNVKDPHQVYEILRKAVQAARKRHNFSYREEM